MKVYQNKREWYRLSLIQSKNKKYEREKIPKYTIVYNYESKYKKL